MFAKLYHLNELNCKYESISIVVFICISETGSYHLND